MEALPYANISQESYPPLVESNAEDIAATAQEMLEELLQAPSLTDFIASWQ